MTNGDNGRWVGRIQGFVVAVALAAACLDRLPAPCQCRHDDISPAQDHVPRAQLKSTAAVGSLRDALTHDAAHSAATANAAITAAANTLKPVVPGVDLAAVLTAAPRYVAWRARRRFNKVTAQHEGVWTPAKGGTNLTPVDREIIADICFNSNSVFETGVGESTKICTFTGVPRYTGVDNAVEWLQNVMKAAPSHYRFHWADIGAITAYSQPVDTQSSPKWPLASFAALAAEDRPFDFYFVDGRFRVASFAASMLHALLRSKKDALFAIHDYPRVDYKGCEAIGELVRGFSVDEGAQVAVFRMRENISAEKVIAVWDEHKYTKA